MLASLAIYPFGTSFAAYMWLLPFVGFGVYIDAPTPISDADSPTELP